MRVNLVIKQITEQLTESYLTRVITIAFTQAMAKLSEIGARHLSWIIITKTWIIYNFNGAKFYFIFETIFCLRKKWFTFDSFQSFIKFFVLNAFTRNFSATVQEFLHYFEYNLIKLQKKHKNNLKVNSTKNLKIININNMII